MYTEKQENKETTESNKKFLSKFWDSEKRPTQSLFFSFAIYVIRFVHVISYIEQKKLSRSFLLKSHKG